MRQEGGQFFQFLVYGYPQGLEDPGSWMQSPPAPPGSLGLFQQFHQLPGRLEGAPAAFFHHQAGDTPGPMLLAILPENPFQLRFEGAV